MSDHEPPIATLWRTKLRSTLLDVDHSAQVSHCVERGLIGIGWRMDDLPSRASLEAAGERIERTQAPGWGRTAAQIVRRFGEEASIGDYVWTRDTHGRYLVCRIAGPYRYDGSSAAKAVDVHQVRDVQWAPRPLNDLEVPGGVIRCFVGTGQSFSRIHDRPARELMPYLWAQLHGQPLPKLSITPMEVLANHLDPYDVEDLVYVWLQAVRGYVALPRSRKRDTPAYEWTMVHRNDGHRAILQIKTGADHVDLKALADARVDPGTRAFAFAASNHYDGARKLVDEVIEHEDLLEFARQHPELLPTRVRTWFALASQPGS